MQFFQKVITLKEYKRGFHLITREVISHIPEIKNISTGMCNVFIQHTSAGLTINENADPTVRKDFESHFNKMVPEDMPYYQHDYEGSDDMPAHLKSSLLGCSVNIPVTNGELNLGTWQGIYLCEHRDHGGKRNIVITLFGN
jgi:secondary thiamine-phosphate synthase enzyme